MFVTGGIGGVHRHGEDSKCIFCLFKKIKIKIISISEIFKIEAPFPLYGTADDVLEIKTSSYDKKHPRCLTFHWYLVKLKQFMLVGFPSKIEEAKLIVCFSQWYT